MNKQLQIFLEYKIDKKKRVSYEQDMKQVLNVMSELEANNIQWFVHATQSDQYVEMFRVPTESHYYALKKIRSSLDHQVFGVLDDYIDGGLNNINYWALRAM